MPELSSLRVCEKREYFDTHTSSSLNLVFRAGMQVCDKIQQILPLSSTLIFKMHVNLLSITNKMTSRSDRLSSQKKGKQ